MRHANSEMRPAPFSPFLSGILGITLLLPGTYFILALLVRIFFGSTTLYYTMAPSFLQSPFNLFAWHKAQVIFGSLVLAILLNVLAILRFRLQRGNKGMEVEVSYKRNWLNTAIALQSGLLLLVLVIYMVIQHVRY